MKNRYPAPSQRICSPERENIECSIPELFEEAVVRFSERIAVKNGEKTLPFKELNESANRIAWALVRRLLPVKALFDSPTVADMAAVVARNRTNKAEQEDPA
jgi:non-ribosomal peptide synthetase component F